MNPKNQICKCGHFKINHLDTLEFSKRKKNSFTYCREDNCKCKKFEPKSQENKKGCGKMYFDSEKHKEMNIPTKCYGRNLCEDCKTQNPIKYKCPKCHSIKERKKKPACLVCDICLIEMIEVKER